MSTKPRPTKKIRCVRSTIARINTVTAGIFSVSARMAPCQGVAPIRRTLIRPPVVNRESSPVARFFPREQGTTWDPRGATDFISTAVSDTVVCTKYLLRLELETTTRPRHQRGEPQRLRGLETHRCPRTGRLKATGSGRSQSQLARGSGEGQPTARRVNVMPSGCRASTGVPIAINKGHLNGRDGMSGGLPGEAIVAEREWVGQGG
jgi:hypothetical protein